MMFEKICLQFICLFLQEQSILSDSTCSSITSYATEGSTFNLTFNNEKHKYRRYRIYTRNKDTGFFSSVNANKYDIKVHPPVSEFQIINVTARYKGYYWYTRRKIYGRELNIHVTNRSCPSTSTNRICAIAGSSPKLKSRIDAQVYYSTSCTSEKKIGSEASKITIHAVIQIYNVTCKDEGVYQLFVHFPVEPTRLQLVNLFIVNQTDLKTIVGQEGKEMEIKCSTNTVQYITGLHIESNGSIMAIGDNQSVSFLFIPDRTDHLTTYKCVDITHSSIMTEVKLIIRYLFIVNQTDLKTIVGQEGKEMEIKCSTNTVQYITGLHIESNGSIMAIGDNQSVSFLFIPDRTDHLTTYKCVDITHSSIMTEVKLIIRYSPVVTGHLTNETIKCDCDGFPEKYSVYRLDQISNYGELVRSVNLNTEIFTFQTDPLPYQINGRYICFVSNGIPDTTGKVLQTWSTDVKYEGPPVFSPENRNVKHGEVGISISMSFYIYSYPAVDEVNIENIGQKQNKFEKLKNYNILKSTLLYTEFDNAVGVEGYEILIESEVLEIDDFHAYLIIAKNHLGESKYRFEIIDQENLPLAKGKRIIFVIVCCIASILLVYLTITHVCVCVKHVKIRNQRLQNLQEDHIYHTYDEIGTLSFRAVSSLHSADIIDNLGQNPTGEHTHNVSVDVNLQSTTDYTTELNAGFLNDGLQREITDVHGQGRSISLLDTNFSNTDVSPISFTGISRINCNQTSRNTDRSREQKIKHVKHAITLVVGHQMMLW